MVIALVKPEYDGLGEVFAFNIQLDAIEARAVLIVHFERKRALTQQIDLAGLPRGMIDVVRADEYVPAALPEVRSNPGVERIAVLAGMARARTNSRF
jgi:hypothetical protein